MSAKCHDVKKALVKGGYAAVFGMRESETMRACVWGGGHGHIKGSTLI